MNNESLAYVRLRSAELATERLATDDARVKADRALAQQLSKDFPASARIATVWARYDRSVDRARQAVAIDPRYAPARVALANALVDAGDVIEAKRVIEAVKNLANLDDGFTVLARVRWAEGNAKGAIEAASKELKGRDAIGVEPGDGDVRAIAKAHEVLGLAYVKQGKPDKAAPHLVAAEETSTAVRDVIRDAPPALPQGDRQGEDERGAIEVGAPVSASGIGHANKERKGEPPDRCDTVAGCRRSQGT